MKRKTIGSIVHLLRRDRFLVTHEAARKILSSDPTLPIFVSFPRTGSHWIRLVMELYFERPALVRAFYYPLKGQYTCYHTHDMKLSVSGRRVMYLVRNPIDVVYSQMRYEGQPLSDQTIVKLWSTHYALHLEKWLLHSEQYCDEILFLSYERFRNQPILEFQKICSFFGQPFEEHRFGWSIDTVDKAETVRHTRHDPAVVNMDGEYHTSREEFRRTHRERIRNAIQNISPELAHTQNWSGWGFGIA